MRHSRACTTRFGQPRWPNRGVQRNQWVASSRLAMHSTPRLCSASEHFLSKLLAYRRKFRHVGVLSASVNGALVSWVDVMLANIAMTSVCISSCIADMDGMRNTLARQEEVEAIRAASQLPCKLSQHPAYILLNKVPDTWPEMLDLLTSNMASCTLLRLSLRLTFVAYVIHPQLSGMRPRVETSVPSVS